MRAPPRSVLIVVTRRLGDVLLATPLMRSIKQAWPQAVLDALVFKGTEGALAGNQDVRQVLTVPERPGLLQHLRFIGRLLRRYDIALSAAAADRPTLYAFLAGRWRAGLLSPAGKEAWKRRLLHAWVPFDNLNTHTVPMGLALADLLGAPRSGEVVIKWDARDEQYVAELLGGDSGMPLAVLHTYPKFNYKMWRREGWAEVAHWFAAHGHRVVLTGGGATAELDYVAKLARDMPPGTVNAAGRLTLGASACLVSRARIYVGPDTVMTHVAAALGVPTVALFGPSNPVKWGPWPHLHLADANPWRRCGSQRGGNVTLLQGALSCVPCLLEGCGRNIASFSDCLQQLPASKVIAALADALGMNSSRAAMHD